MAPGALKYSRVVLNQRGQPMTHNGVCTHTLMQSDRRRYSQASAETLEHEVLRSFHLRLLKWRNRCHHPGRGGASSHLSDDESHGGPGALSWRMAEFWVSGSKGFSREVIVKKRSDEDEEEEGWRAKMAQDKDGRTVEMKITHLEQSLLNYSPHILPPLRDVGVKLVQIRGER